MPPLRSSISRHYIELLLEVDGGEVEVSAKDAGKALIQGVNGPDETGNGDKYTYTVVLYKEHKEKLLYRSCANPWDANRSAS